MRLAVRRLFLAVHTARGFARGGKRGGDMEVSFSLPSLGLFSFFLAVPVWGGLDGHYFYLFFIVVLYCIVSYSGCIVICCPSFFFFFSLSAVRDRTDIQTSRQPDKQDSGFFIFICRGWQTFCNFSDMFRLRGCCHTIRCSQSPCPTMQIPDKTDQELFGDPCSDRHTRHFTHTHTHIHSHTHTHTLTHTYIHTWHNMRDDGGGDIIEYTQHDHWIIPPCWEVVSSWSTADDGYPSHLP